MGGIPFSILVSYIVAHGEFFGNIGKAYPCVKGKHALEFPEFLVKTVVPERHLRKRWGTQRGRGRHSFEPCPLLSKKCLPHHVRHIFFINLCLFHFRICRTCYPHLISQTVLAQCILDTCPFLNYLLLRKITVYDPPRMLAKPPRGELRGILANESKLKKRI
jgi:hypothetical protein